MTHNLLFKYISGQASLDEIQHVRVWVEGSDKRAAELSRLKNIWILSGLDNGIDPEIKSVEIQKILSKIRKISLDQKKIRSYQWIKYAAAVAAIVLFSGIGSLMVSKFITIQPDGITEVIASRGERSKVILPDGSTVMLNCGSSLKFPNFFKANKREVVLEGEAFFEVVKSKSIPFIVAASDVNVQVLGTRFNVKCYPEDKSIETFLESGSVEVSSDESNNSVVLKPLEAVLYSKTTKLFSEIEIQNGAKSDWTRGILTFNNETIEELANKLERRYDIDIVFGSEGVKDRIYTGSISDDNLFTVLEAIKFASSINYHVKGKTVTLSSK